MKHARPLLVTGAVGLALLTSACTGTASMSSSSGDMADDGDVVVTLTGHSCMVPAHLGAGAHTFEVTNSGPDVSEFVVTAHDGTVAGEVEGIRPSSMKELTAKLPAGSYTATCKADTGEMSTSPISVK